MNDETRRDSGKTKKGKLVSFWWSDSVKIFRQTEICVVIRNICEVNRCKVVKVLYVSVIVIVSFQSKRKEDPFQTTDADLAGFWDMVLLQVADVDRMFNELDELKRHDWNARNVNHTLTVSIARP